MDPRSDGNYSFGGRNWLYNNISLDGSYFNNPFGLDDPSPGGQANAEPVPFEAIEQVQVSVAPFDVRQGGFTGAGINTVTKSGTNEFKASLYSYNRNQAMLGNEVAGVKVFEDPDLSFMQSGFTLSGPIIPDKLFFFVNAEMERRDDPGTNYVADEDGTITDGESRVSADVMDQIRDRMLDVYNYDTGPYQDYIHETNNNKFLVKLNWNLSDAHKFTFRYNYLDAFREQGPHPFVLSAFNTGRGPNTSSLPFRNSGYKINNDLSSYAAELNSVFGNKIANRFFFSLNVFRDSRDPFSEPFPTVEIAEDGVTYTTLGHEPFSIHNILDQDVIQITDNLSYFMGSHTITVGFTYERYKFFNSFNIFRHGLFMLPAAWGIGGTFSTLDEFFAETDPDSAYNLTGFITPETAPFKGEDIDVGQLAFYGQDEMALSRDLNVTVGLRVDMPQYYTEPEPNPFSTSLTALDENDEAEEINQAKLPDAQLMFSPRVGFNWDISGDRSFQVRGGSGIFTGRIPFVWFGNVISNPGSNPNLYPTLSEADALADHTTDEGGDRGTSILQQSFDLNAMVDDFKWPQVWTTNLAMDKLLPGDFLLTVEGIYGKDLNAIYMRNADLVTPQYNLADGRPYFGAATFEHELNTNYPGENAGIYVIDNTDEGYNMTLTAQLSKAFSANMRGSLAYTFLEAKNNLKSTEIASVLWQNQPVQGDPNQPNLSFSEFGSRHRVIGTFNYRMVWSKLTSTNVGLFFEMAQGNQFTAAGGNRFSYIYSGDVNGDGYAGNDLIYIPEDENDINLADAADWALLDDFIEQDDYLSANRGKIADRMSSTVPWFANIDLKIAQDFNVEAMGRTHQFQLTFDILNAMNLLNSDWGVRQAANPLAASPLTLTGWTTDTEPEPIFSFNGAEETYVNSFDELSRWRMQLGLKYAF